MHAQMHSWAFFRPMDCPRPDSSLKSADSMKSCASCSLEQYRMRCSHLRSMTSPSGSENFFRWYCRLVCLLISTLAASVWNLVVGCGGVNATVVLVAVAS
jgi:hypothetical protein